MNILRSRKFAAASSLVATLGLITSTGFGQASTAALDAARTDDSVKLEKFEVTGSFIKVSELVGPSPVDIVNERAIRTSGITDVAQLLKKLNPDFQGNGNTSTEVNNGGGGESNLALRNLTTLILVDGRRMPTSPFSNGASVDTSTIPLSMIDRIEVLKDGASTLYGSDAIAGVVNIILKKDLNGFELRVRYGQTRNRDYTAKGASIVGGVSIPGTFLTVDIDTFRNDQLATNKRAIASLSSSQLNALGAVPGVLPSYYSGSFAGRVGNYILAGSPLAAGAPGYNAAINTPPAKTDPNAAPQTLAQLNAAGIYLLTSTTPASVAAGGGATILNTTQYGTASIVPTDRRQMILNGEHEIYGKHLVGYIEGLYSQLINAGSVLAPSPLAGVGANNLIIPANNPYNLFGINIGKGFTGDPGVRTRLESLGNRKATLTSDTYRLISGLKGEINENYSWQVDGTYARSGTTQQVYGGANGAVMNQLLTPLLNAAGGYTYNAAGRPLSVYTDSSGNVPVYNYFAAGSFAQDPRALAAINTVLYRSGVSELSQGNALFRGTPFDLPAGKFGFAVGVEYRKEELASSVDGTYAQGLALGYNAASTFSGGKRSTKSGFLELDAPVFGNSFVFPGFHYLDLNASGRYEKLSTGDISRSPKVGFKWQPLDNDLSIRGTYATGFVAPTIFQLFGPAAGNSPTFTVPEGTTTSSGGSDGKSVTGQFGGNTSELSNPQRKSSASISRTLGIIYSPRQVRGLSASIDYYFVKQGQVGGIDYTSIYADLNKNGAASRYASTFIFADGSKLTSNAPGQITSTNIGGIAVQTAASGEQYTDGLDLGLEYIIPSDYMFGFGKATIGANANVLFNYKFRPNPGSGNQQYARQFTSGTYGLGGSNGVLPGYKLDFLGNWAYRGFTVASVISCMPTVTDSGSLFGNQSTTNTTRADGKKYQIPAITTIDLSVGYELHGLGWYNGIGLLVGVDNLGNRTAPYIPNGPEDNTDKRSYDIIGRFYFAEVSKKF